MHTGIRRLSRVSQASEPLARADAVPLTPPGLNQPVTALRRPRPAATGRRSARVAVRPLASFLICTHYTETRSLLAIHPSQLGELQQSLKVVDVPEPAAPAAGQEPIRVEYAPLDHHDRLLALDTFPVWPGPPRIDR